MSEADIENILHGAKEKFPRARPRIISNNGPQFIAKDFKEISGMTHVLTSPFYPQSNRKIERWRKSLKGGYFRPGTPLSLDDAGHLVSGYVDHYNNVRLNSAVGYVTPKDMLSGRQQEIHAERDRKWGVLKPGGRMITIAADSEGTADQRVKDAFFIVEPNQNQLVEIAKQLDAGQLKAFVKTTVPLNEAYSAYSGGSRAKADTERSSSPFPRNPSDTKKRQNHYDRLKVKRARQQIDQSVTRMPARSQHGCSVGFIEEECHEYLRRGCELRHWQAAHRRTHSLVSCCASHVTVGKRSTGVDS